MIGICIMAGDNEQKDEDLGEAESLVASASGKWLLFVPRVEGECLVASCWLGSFWAGGVLDA